MNDQPRLCGQCGTVHIIPEDAECLKLTREQVQELSIWAMKAQLDCDWVRQNYYPISKVVKAALAERTPVNTGVREALERELREDLNLGDDDTYEGYGVKTLMGAFDKATAHARSNRIEVPLEQIISAVAAFLMKKGETNLAVEVVDVMRQAPAPNEGTGALK